MPLRLQMLVTSVHNEGYHTLVPTKTTMYLDKYNDADCRLILSVTENKPESLKKALQDPDCNPTLENNLLIKDTILGSNAELFQILIEDGRVDPSYNNNDCLSTLNFNRPPTNDQQIILDILKKHPKVLAKSIRLNQKHHTDKDIEMMKKEYPELLI